MSNALSKSLQISIAPLITAQNKSEWEKYSVDHQAWIDEGLETAADYNHTFNPKDGSTFFRENLIQPHVWRLDSNGQPIVQEDSEVSFGLADFAPVWQQSPAPHDTSAINFDLLSHPVFRRIYHGMWETQQAVMSEVTDLAFLYQGAVKDDITQPHSFLMHPIYPTLTNQLQDRNAVVGFLVAVLPWDIYFANILSQGVNGIVVVLHNTCGEHFTYEINGPDVVFVGKGDLHDKTYDSLQVESDFAPFVQHNFSDAKEHCEYDFRIYPSSEFESVYKTKQPMVYTVVVVLVFLFTSAIFLLYDYLVEVRQRKVMATAKRANDVVASFFPKNVRDRIMQDAEEQAHQENELKKGLHFGLAAKTQLKDFLHDEHLGEDGGEGSRAFATKPIADL